MDGHDIPATEQALRRASAVDGPVLVHVVTVKGKGYPPAERDEIDHLHAVGVVGPATGHPPVPGELTWTSVFAEEITALGAERTDLVCVTAAMSHPVGLARFAARFPNRVFDVGIAEQHAVVCAAGLAIGGRHPVVAIYSTFLSRAFDQVLSDVARLRELLREAVDLETPTAIRYPKATATGDIPAMARMDGIDVLHRSRALPLDVLVVCAGPMAGAALGVARTLARDGIGVTVVDPRWVLPVNPGLTGSAARHRLVATVEDGIMRTVHTTLPARSSR